MSQRSTAPIEAYHTEKEEAKQEPTVDSAPTEDSQSAAQIYMHYPRPIPLSALLTDATRWSDYHIIMEPKLDRPLQIFATKPLTQSEAFDLLIASLQTVGLRAIEIKGKLLRIVAKKNSQISA